MVPKIDLTNKRFGRLVALNRVEGLKGNSKWLCECDCGNFKAVEIGSLQRGHTISCGCFLSEKQSEKMKTHGLSQTAEYKSWCMMIRRCTVEDDKSYHNYGGRGISVCSRWIKSFKNFLADMGPSNGLTLDRIDVNGNYEKENCRWATRKMQNNNRRNNVMIDLEDGFGRMSMQQQSERLGVSYTMVRKRIQNGADKKEALLLPNKFNQRG